MADSLFEHKHKKKYNTTRYYKGTIKPQYTVQVRKSQKDYTIV